MNAISTEKQLCSAITTAAINQHNGLHQSHYKDCTHKKLLQTFKNCRRTNNKLIWAITCSLTKHKYVPANKDELVGL